MGRINVAYAIFEGPSGPNKEYSPRKAGYMVAVKLAFQHLIHTLLEKSMLLSK